MTAFSFRKVLVVLFILFAQTVFGQESMLACKFTVGQHLRYKITQNSLLEGGMFPGGRREIITHTYYSLDVTSVDKEGTATVTFTQDSLVFWGNGELMIDEASSSLNGVLMTMWISNRGIILDVDYPKDMSDEASQYLDGLMKDFAAKPPLPGRAVGVGAEWKNDLSVYFIYAFGTAKATNSVTCTYARKENFRGKECARIEYGGNLLSNKQKAGYASGTILLSLREGRVLRVSSKTDVTMYMDVRGGRAQMRVSTTQMQEALN